VIARETYETVDYNRLAYPNYNRLKVVFNKAYVMVDETAVQDNTRKLYFAPDEYKFNTIIAEHSTILSPTVVCFLKVSSDVKTGQWVKISGTLYWRDWVVNASARAFLLVNSITIL